MQGQYWCPDFSNACQHALTVTPGVCHTQGKAVTALVTKAACTELLPGGSGKTAEAKFITITPEINLASGTMASRN